MSEKESGPAVAATGPWQRKACRRAQCRHPPGSAAAPFSSPFNAPGKTGRAGLGQGILRSITTSVTPSAATATGATSPARSPLAATALPERETRAPTFTSV